MGFWHTGYIEFHEPTGIDGRYLPPGPVFPRCPQCAKEFSDAEALTRHRFEAHPYLQPVLFIDGAELIGLKHTISKEVSASNVRCANTSQCWVNNEPLLTDLLSERIAAIRQGFVSVRLRNDIGQVETSYDIDIGIPEPADVAEVDRRFFEFSSVGNLSVLSVNSFIQITRDFSSARTYVDGLSSYLYGVLAKDQRGAIALTREEGRARMTHALQLLSRFSTPLSTVIGQAINFNLNTFSDGSALRSSPELARAMQRFWLLIHPDESVPIAQSGWERQSSKHIPLDICSSQLIDWSLLSSASIVEKKRELEKVLRDDAWVPDDRLKVQILLAASLNKEGDFQGASEYARRLRHDPFWGEWAEALIETNN